MSLPPARVEEVASSRIKIGRKQPEEWEKTVASEGFLLETPSDDTFFKAGQVSGWTGFRQCLNSNQHVSPTEVQHHPPQKIDVRYEKR